MATIITPHIYCPICDKEMVKREIMYQGKYVAMWFCTPCRIGCFEFDPAFNKWRDADKSIPCAICGNPIKWFARYLDGYFKGHCDHCDITFEKDGEVKFGDNGQIILPDDMHDDPIDEEPTRIMISKDKLKKRRK
jgi:endogenous inhibitor of DNA gyrase (YacG/DUF329 family)